MEVEGVDYNIGHASEDPQPDSLRQAGKRKRCTWDLLDVTSLSHIPTLLAKHNAFCASMFHEFAYQHDPWLLGGKAQGKAMAPAHSHKLCIMPARGGVAGLPSSCFVPWMGQGAGVQ